VWRIVDELGLAWGLVLSLMQHVFTELVVISHDLQIDLPHPDWMDIGSKTPSTTVSLGCWQLVLGVVSGPRQPVLGGRGALMNK
jgi:hypothetical protein